MKKMMITVVAIVLAANTFAGAVGLVVKGVTKTWDEVAKIALKVSGRTASDDAVKVAAKTLERTSAKYGDDVAKASMRGGIEVAEQVAKHGGRFASVVKAAAHSSDAALRTLTLGSDKAARICATHGDDVVRAVAKLPVEDGTRLLGVVDRNPQVAKELLAETEKGGKEFLDRLFKVNGTQILAGTLGTAAIVGVVRKTAPEAAEGKSIERHTEMATDLLGSGKPLTHDQKAAVEKWSSATVDARRARTWGALAIGMTLAAFAGVSLLVFAVRKSRGDGYRKKSA